MKKLKLQLTGTRSVTSHRNIMIEFTTYIPRTDTTYAKAYIPKEFRKT